MMGRLGTSSSTPVNVSFEGSDLAHHTEIQDLSTYIAVRNDHNIPTALAMMGQYMNFLEGFRLSFVISFKHAGKIRYEEHADALTIFGHRRTSSSIGIHLSPSLNRRVPFLAEHPT